MLYIVYRFRFGYSSTGFSSSPFSLSYVHSIRALQGKGKGPDGHPYSVTADNKGHLIKCGLSKRTLVRISLKSSENLSHEAVIQRNPMRRRRKIGLLRWRKSRKSHHWTTQLQLFSTWSLSSRAWNRPLKFDGSELRQQLEAKARRDTIWIRYICWAIFHSVPLASRRKIELRRIEVPPHRVTRGSIQEPASIRHELKEIRRTFMSGAVFMIKGVTMSASAMGFWSGVKCDLRKSHSRNRP